MRPKHTGREVELHGDVEVRPFGWEPSGRLAVLAQRPHPDEQLSIEAARLVFKGIPKNTRETYARQWWKYVQWCGQTGRVELPATPATVIEWMNELWRTPGRYGRPTAPASVRLSLAVIAVAHKRARRPELDEAGRPQYGYVPPSGHPTVVQAMRGYALQWAEAGHRPDRAHDLSPEELLEMVATLDVRTPMGLCDALLLAIGYDLGGRRVELCNLNVGDVDVRVANRDAITTDDYIVINIAMSKTDQQGEGAEIPLYAHPDEFSSTCPVRLALRWLDLLDEHGPVDPRSPLLRIVRTGGRKPQDGRPQKGTLTRERIGGERVADVVARTGHLAGLNSGGGRRKHVVPHSLRAGAATAAAENGADTAALNAHFRWSQYGSTANRYVRAGRRKTLNPARRIWNVRNGG